MGNLFSENSISDFRDRILEELYERVQLLDLDQLLGENLAQNRERLFQQFWPKPVLLREGEKLKEKPEEVPFGNVGWGFRHVVSIPFEGGKELFSILPNGLSELERETVVQGKIEGAFLIKEFAEQTDKYRDIEADVITWIESIKLRIRKVNADLSGVEAQVRDRLNHFMIERYKFLAKGLEHGA